MSQIDQQPMEQPQEAELRRRMRYLSNTNFEASTHLSEVITTQMNERGRRRLGSAGLILATRPMEFTSATDLQRFEGTISNRHFYYDDSDLRRIALGSNVILRASRDKSMVRLFFRPNPVPASLLADIYNRYSAQFGTKSYNPNDPSEWLYSSSLTTTVRANELNDGADAAESINRVMRQAALGRRGAFYAWHPSQNDHRVDG